MTQPRIGHAAVILVAHHGERGAIAHCLSYAERASERNDVHRRTYFERVAAFITTCRALNVDVRQAVSSRSVA